MGQHAQTAKVSLQTKQMRLFQERPLGDWGEHVVDLRRDSTTTPPSVDELTYPAELSVGRVAGEATVLRSAANRGVTPASTVVVGHDRIG